MLGRIETRPTVRRSAGSGGEQAILPSHACFIDRPISYWGPTADRRGNKPGIGCTVIECDEIIGSKDGTGRGRSADQGKSVRPLGIENL